MASKAKPYAIFWAAFFLTLSNFEFTAAAPPDSVIPKAPSSPSVVPKLPAAVAVSNYNALGDSFGAGVAAGSPYNGGGGGCNRYDGAYSVKLNNRIRARTFNFIACTGATTGDVLKNQVPSIDQAADFISVTMGGNNIGFGNIVNGCVYRFNGPFAPNCDDALTSAERAINDDNVLLNPVSDAIRGMLARAPNAMVSLTGYAMFWNATTTQCDTVSWNYWNVPGATKMTRAVRQKMNDLLVSTNGKLNTAVQNLNRDFPGRVSFIDYDAAFEGHRFCEEGVIEPQKSGEDRSNTYFFQLNTPVGSLAGGDEAFVPSSSPANTYYDALESYKSSNPGAE
ncbi:hypothetical protein GP486_008434, partial [Trichoglossum hirsutum]